MRHSINLDLSKPLNQDLPVIEIHDRDLRSQSVIVHIYRNGEEYNLNSESSPYNSAKYSLVCNGVLVCNDQDVLAFTGNYKGVNLGDNGIAIHLSDKNNQNVISGRMLVELCLIGEDENHNPIMANLIFEVRVHSSIIDSASVHSDSYGTIYEAIQEITTARKGYPTLSDSLDSKVDKCRVISSETDLNNITEEFDGYIMVMPFVNNLPYDKETNGLDILHVSTYKNNSNQTIVYQNLQDTTTGRLYYRFGTKQNDNPIVWDFWKTVDIFNNVDLSENSEYMPYDATILPSGLSMVTKSGYISIEGNVYLVPKDSIISTVFVENDNNDDFKYREVSFIGEYIRGGEGIGEGEPCGLFSFQYINGELVGGYVPSFKKISDIISSKLSRNDLNIEHYNVDQFNLVDLSECKDTLKLYLFDFVTTVNGNQVSIDYNLGGYIKYMGDGIWYCLSNTRHKGLYIIHEDGTVDVLASENNPTENDDSLITSGAVYNALLSKVNFEHVSYSYGGSGGLNYADQIDTIYNVYFILSCGEVSPGEKGILFVPDENSQLFISSKGDIYTRKFENELWGQFSRTNVRKDDANLEIGVFSSSAWYTEVEGIYGKTIYGTYQIMGDYIFITAEAHKVEGWSHIFYSLPMAPKGVTSTIVSGITNRYLIQNTTLEDRGITYPVLDITTIDGREMTQGTVSFTIAYKIR